jgi:hypothetical protein
MKHNKAWWFLVEKAFFTFIDIDEPRVLRALGVKSTTSN